LATETEPFLLFNYIAPPNYNFELYLVAWMGVLLLLWLWPVSYLCYYCYYDWDWFN